MALGDCHSVSQTKERCHRQSWCLILFRKQTNSYYVFTPSTPTVKKEQFPKKEFVLGNHTKIDLRKILLKCGGVSDGDLLIFPEDRSWVRPTRILEVSVHLVIVDFFSHGEHWGGAIGLACILHQLPNAQLLDLPSRKDHISLTKGILRLCSTTSRTFQLIINRNGWIGRSKCFEEVIATTFITSSIITSPLQRRAKAGRK